MRGGALDLRRPLQRRHRQPASALGRTDAAARRWGGASVNGVSEIVGTVDSSDRHGNLPWMAIYTQYEHIWVLRNPATRAGGFANCVSLIQTYPQHRGRLGIRLGSSTYPHNEQ